MFVYYRERLYMEECVVSKTATCTYNRKRTFLSTVDWFKNVTQPSCEVVTSLEMPNCSLAHRCVERGLHYLTQRESYQDMDQFCW